MGNKALCGCGSEKESISEQQSIQPQNSVQSQYNFKNIEIKLIKGSLTEETADVIVNASQTNPFSSTDSFILRAAGNGIMQNLMGRSPPEIGQTQNTEGGQLHCKYIIHITLPKWEGEDGGQNDLVELIQSYSEVMIAQEKLKATSIIFCDDKQENNFTYPKLFHANALCVAITQFIDQHPESNLKSIKYISHDHMVIRNLDFEIRKRIEINEVEDLKIKEKERFIDLEKSYTEKANSLSSRTNLYQNQASLSQTTAQTSNKQQKFTNDEQINQNTIENSDNKKTENSTVFM